MTRNVAEAGLTHGLLITVIFQAGYAIFLRIWGKTLQELRSTRVSRMQWCAYRMDVATITLYMLMTPIITTSGADSKYSGLALLAAAATIPPEMARNLKRYMKLSGLGQVLAFLVYCGLALYGLVEGSLTVVSVRPDIQHLLNTRITYVSYLQPEMWPMHCKTALVVALALFRTNILPEGMSSKWKRILSRLFHVMYIVALVAVVFAWRFQECDTKKAQCVFIQLHNYSITGWGGRWVMGALLIASPLLNIPDLPETTDTNKDVDSVEDPELGIDDDTDIP